MCVYVCVACLPSGQTLRHGDGNIIVCSRKISGKRRRRRMREIKTDRDWTDKRNRPIWTVNLWIYHRCVTLRFTGDKKWLTKRMLLFASHSLRHNVNHCDVWQICGLCFFLIWTMFRIFSKIYRNHGSSMWRFCFANIISNITWHFAYVVGGFVCQKPIFFPYTVGVGRCVEYLAHPCSQASWREIRQ